MSSSKIILIFFILLGVFFIFGCSSNQPGIETGEGLTGEPTAQDQSEIDELFQIINQSESQKDETTGEDEVFELLGIQKQQKESGSVEEQTKSDDQLKKDIDLLEQRLAEKDAEIANLRSNIETKDAEINKLESNTVKPSEARSSVSAELTGNFKQDYQLALEVYNNRNYKQAIQMFEALLAISQTNSLSDNCRYWIGESYYGLGNYNQAIIEFTKVFSFNNSNKMDAAQLKLGLCYWRLGDTARALQELERVINDYPKSEFVEKAQQFIAKLQ